MSRSSDEERAALSFGILIGYLGAGGLVLLDASAGWWIGMIGTQVLIAGFRFWRAFG